MSNLQSLFDKFSKSADDYMKCGLRNRKLLSITNEFKEAIGISASVSETRFMLLNRLSSRPLCSVCQQKTTAYLGQSIGYQRTCSIKCSRSLDSFRDSLKNPDTIAKRNKSVVEAFKRMGVTNCGQLQKTKDKIKQTLLDRYGVDSVLKVASIREKGCKTNLQNYGAENVLSASSTIRQQMNTRAEIEVMTADKWIKCSDCGKAKWALEKRT